jgi:hypothetical protein
VFFMFHVKFVHYMLKKRQLAIRPLMCPRLFFFFKEKVATIYTKNHKKNLAGIGERMVPDREMTRCFRKYLPGFVFISKN